MKLFQASFVAATFVASAIVVNPTTTTGASSADQIAWGYNQKQKGQNGGGSSSTDSSSSLAWGYNQKQKGQNGGGGSSSTASSSS
jgi:hypothetical protein